MKISAALLIVLLASPVLAGDHIGRVTLPNGVPIPGARVTATQGSNTLVTTTDAQGGYRFAGIADGPWTMQVEMIGLSTQRRELTIAAAAGSRSTCCHSGTRRRSRRQRRIPSSRRVSACGCGSLDTTAECCSR